MHMRTSAILFDGPLAGEVRAGPGEGGQPPRALSVGQIPLAPGLVGFAVHGGVPLIPAGSTVGGAAGASRLGVKLLICAQLDRLVAEGGAAPFHLNNGGEEEEKVWEVKTNQKTKVRSQDESERKKVKGMKGFAPYWSC